MSVGKSFLASVIKSNNKNFLNRIKPELFYNKAISGDAYTELGMLEFVQQHVLHYRVLPSKSVIEQAGYAYLDSDQPPEFYIDKLKDRAVFNAYKTFQPQMQALVTQGFNLDQASDLIKQFGDTISYLSVSDKFKSVREIGQEIQGHIEQRKNGVPEVFIPFGWPTLDNLTGGISGGDLAIFAARPGVGKALPLDTRILMADGSYKRMGDISVGDKLASVDGEPSEVYGIAPQGTRPVYLVTFADGRSEEADEDHLWKVGSKYFDGDKTRIMSTKEILRHLTKAQRYAKHLWVETISGEFGNTLPFMDPYTLGVLLGDGCLVDSARFTTMDAEVAERVQSNLLAGYRFTVQQKQGTSAKDYSIVRADDNEETSSTYLNTLRSRNLMGKLSKDKFIPAECFLWNKANRLELLRGLMDSDGTVNLSKGKQANKGKIVSGTPSFGSSSRQLFEDVVRLTRSLGGKAKEQKVKKTTHLDHYRATLITKENVFNLERKARLVTAYTTHNPNYLRIETIKYVADKPTQCIGVTHRSKLFIVGEYIPTHNSSAIAFMSHNAWKCGFSPLVLTMEMTDVQLARRIYGIEGQFNPNLVRKGIPDNAVEGRLEAAVNAFDAGVPFNIICGQIRQTVETITSLVDELRPDVLYIDAAYLISVKGSASKMWERLSIVAERLKELAITRNIPIIITVQFNRDAAKSKTFELETLAGSDALGQLGSIIVSIKVADEPNEETRRTLNVIKNREGGVEEFDIHYTFDPPTFGEVLVTDYVAGHDDEIEL